MGALAEELGVPGVAVGIAHGDEDSFAYHGVTSVENPLPDDGTTLFQFGSTGKTFTSVAILRLVEARTVDLDAPGGSEPKSKLLTAGCNVTPARLPLGAARSCDNSLRLPRSSPDNG